VQLKESGAKGVVVTGCMAQRYADELAGELPEVDAVVGFEKYSDIGPRIEEIITKSGYAMPTVEVGSTDVPFRPEWERYRITQQHAGYLRVAGDSSTPPSGTNMYPITEPLGRVHLFTEPLGRLHPFTEPLGADTHFKKLSRIAPAVLASSPRNPDPTNLNPTMQRVAITSAHSVRSPRGAGASVPRALTTS
jgi:hypothetical protein